MTKYESLTRSLQEYFDQPTGKLANWLKKHPPREPEEPPFSLGKRFEEAFYLVPWKSLSPNRRRDRAMQADFRHDPDCRQAMEQLWDLYCQIAETAAAAAPTVSDLELRETRIRRFEEAIRQVESEMQAAALARWQLPANLLPSDQTAILALIGTGFPGRPSQTVHLIQDEIDRRIATRNLEGSLKKQAEVLVEWLRIEYPTLARPKPTSVANAISAKYRAARDAQAHN